MTNRTSRRAGLITSFLLAVSLLALPAGNPAQSNKNKGGGGAQAQKTTFSGRATAVKAVVAGQPITLSDTGALDSTGGEKEASLLEAAVPGLLTAEVLHASTVGNGNNSRSEASVANLALTVGGNAIAADFLMARAQAACADGASAGGGSEIVNLVINGQPVTVTGEPNQTVDLPVGQVIINEQTSDRQGDITVNALHVIIPSVADVIIASAHADITCGKVACPGKDFVTGGGWILTPAGSKGTFGVAGGIKGKGLWGHLTYIDHGTNLKVKGTGVTSYVVTGPTSRQIEGTCEINGVPGTYKVDLADNGEPGRGRDLFTITLSTGYTAGGALEGGNVQLHAPCK